MARYSVGFQKVSTAAAGMIAQLRTPAGGDARVVEIGIFASTAVASTVGLVRSATVGATFTSITPAAEDPKASATGTLLDTAATTAPTLAAVYLRRCSLPAQIGAGMVWAWEGSRGLFIPASSSLVLWQLSTAIVTYDGYMTYED